MHKAVYYHKTTYGIEEAARQLLRRVRDAAKYEIPKDGKAIHELVTGSKLGEFTDALVDRIIENAAEDSDPVICSLANCIRRRNPPRLLKEVCVLEATSKKHHAGSAFREKCRHNLNDLAKKHSVELGRFLICQTPPLTFEERGPHLSEKQARSLEPEQQEELIKVFVGENEEPISAVAIEHSILYLCSNHFYQSFRLYFVPADDDPPELVNNLRDSVRAWDES